jgi:uncharacterized membrane protein
MLFVLGLILLLVALVAFAIGGALILSIFAVVMTLVSALAKLFEIAFDGIGANRRFRRVREVTARPPEQLERSAHDPSASRAWRR